MKKKQLFKGLLLVSIAALTFVACGKKTTKTNKTTNKTTGNKTQITTTNKTTKAKTTTEVKEKVLSANKFYLSNDEKMIIKAFADNNKVSDLLIYSTYGATAYIKPLIENNKFKALSIVDNTSYSIYNKDLFYLKGYNDFVPIMDVLITSIYDGYVAVSKPLYVKMSDDLITVKFNDKTYSINLDGSINEKEFNEITSSFNPTSITTSLDNDILKVNSNGVTSTLSKDSCSTKTKYSSVDLKFNNGQIVKIVDADNPNYDRTMTITLNDDLSVDTAKKELEYQTSLLTYTYSSDYKTITIKETELYDDTNATIFAPKGKMSAMPFDCVYTLEYDNYFRIASSKEKVSIEDIVYYESESIYTYNNKGYLATETSSQNYGNNYKYVYDYNNDGYVTKIDYYNLNNGDNVESTDYYEYDNNNRLIKYIFKYAVEDFDRQVYEAIYDNNTVTYKIANYYRKDVIDNGFKEYRELDNNGRVTNSTYYSNVESDTPSYQSLYTYSKENEYDVVVEIYKEYDSETNALVNVSRDTTKTKGNKKIVLEDKFISEINDFVLSEIITTEIKNGVECETTDYYDYDTTTYEPFIKSSAYSEESDEYYLHQQIHYYNGVVSSGRREVNGKNYTEVYFYNTTFNDFSIESKDETLDNNVTRKTQYTYTNDVLSTKIETTKKSVNSQELTLKELKISYTDEGSEKVRVLDEFEYDDKNNVTNKLYERYEYGELKEKSTLEKTFTSSNKISTSIEKKYDANGLYYTQNIENTYNSDGKCIRTCCETIETGEPYSKELHEYEFDGSTMIYETMSYRDENDNVIYSIKYLCSNYSITILEKELINGELKVVFETILNDSNEIDYTIKYEYSDETGALVDTISYYYSDGEKASKTIQYYENGNVIKKEEYDKTTWGELLTNVYEIIGSSSTLFEGQLKVTEEYTYNSNGNIISEKLYNYVQDSIQWVLTTKYGNAITNIYQEIDLYDSDLNLVYITEYGHYSSAGDCLKTAEYEIIDDKKELIISYEYYGETKTIKCVKLSSLKYGLGLEFLIEVTYDEEGNITSNTIYVNDLDNNFYYTYHIKDTLLNNSNVSSLYSYYKNNTLDTNCTLEEDTTTGTMTINGIINND